MKYIIFAVSLFILISYIVIAFFRKKHHKIFFFRISSVLLIFTLITAINILPLQLANKGLNISNRDIIFVVDLTLSMNANDGRNGNDQTRLENVKDDIRSIASDNVGASVGILTFSDQSNIFLPLAQNSNDIQEAVDTLYTNTEFNTIAQVSSYKQTMESTIKYLRLQKEADPTRERVVVMMSDFEIYNKAETNGIIVQAALPLKDLTGGFVSIVYGKKEGSMILKMKYDFDSYKIVPSYTVNKYPTDKYLNDSAGFDTDKYMDGGKDNNYKALISKSNIELSNLLAKSVDGQSLNYKDTNKFKTAIEKASTKANESSAKDPKSQKLRQNWLYSPVSIILIGWLVILEIFRPNFINNLFGILRGKK